MRIIFETCVFSKLKTLSNWENCMQSPSFASHVRCSTITRRQPISTDRQGTGKVPVKTVAPRQRDHKVVGILSSFKSPVRTLGISDKGSLEKYGWRFLWYITVHLNFNVTFNDISVIFVTAHTCSYAGRLKKNTLNLRSGSHAIDISWGSLTCQSKHRHGTTLLRLFRETAPFQLPFTTRMGIRRTYSHL